MLAPMVRSRAKTAAARTVQAQQTAAIAADANPNRAPGSRPRIPGAGTDPLGSQPDTGIMSRSWIPARAARRSTRALGGYL